jgi:hypothetical protein
MPLRLALAAGGALAAFALGIVLGARLEIEDGAFNALQGPRIYISGDRG